VVEVEQTGLVGCVLLERVEQLRELFVALDAAELGLGGEHPGGAPAQRHLAVLPVLHASGVVADDLDHRLGRVRRIERGEQAAGDAEPVDGDGLGEPFPQRRGGAGALLV